MGGTDQFFESDKHVWQDTPLIAHSRWAGPWSFSFQSLVKLFLSKPDLIHLHGIWGATSAVGRLAQLLNIPVVVSPRGMLDPYILARRATLKWAHAALFEKPLMRRSHVHALCNAERQAIFEFTNCNEERCFTAANGVEKQDGKLTGLKTDSALYLGRLHQKKQVIELIENWPHAADMPVPLTIAGWGNEDYESAVIRAACAHDNVNFVGPLYGEQKTEALETARYFVLPSLSEGLPMAVLQSLQFGCVPLISERCNLPELFTHNVATCLMINFSNLSSVLRTQLAKSETEKQAQAQLSKAFADRYNWGDIATSMIAQYQRVLEGKQNA